MRAPDGQVGGAALRPAVEILDQLDLVYRCHWAVAEAARTGNRELAADLDADVLVERHVALNWLTWYRRLDWDDVSPDT